MIFKKIRQTLLVEKSTFIWRKNHPSTNVSLLFFETKIFLYLFVSIVLRRRFFESLVKNWRTQFPFIWLVYVFIEISVKYMFFVNRC